MNGEIKAYQEAVLAAEEARTKAKDAELIYQETATVAENKRKLAATAYRAMMLAIQEDGGLVDEGFYSW